MYRKMIVFFGKTGIKYFGGYLGSMREEIKKSNMNMLFEYYVGRMIALSVFSFIFIFASITAAFIILGMPMWFAIGSAMLVSSISFIAIITIFHSLPYQTILSKKNKIDMVMPFAINHMAAIASSGVPPFVIFRLISNIPEYTEITNESKRIVRNTEIFGMDIVTAVKNVADRTPSMEFRQFLYGFISSIETGGDIKKYLENSAKEQMFYYRLKREKYLQTLSAYADFYTAVLIAAPLFFISVLSVMSLLGGQIMGLDIPTAMRLGIYVLIPVMNIFFLLFINLTQPSM